MAIDRAPRRITALEHINKVDPNLLNALQQPASSTAPTTEAEREASPAKWFIPLDYKKVTDDADGDSWDDTGESDYGSVRVPMSRIAMRDSNGLVPSSMLPSYVDDMMYGTFTYTSGTKSEFIEEVTGSTEHRTYVSPPSARQTGELEPPDNIVFIDKPTGLQYRFLKAHETDSSAKYGFAEVPGSRAVNAGYGIDPIENDPNTAALTINAKKADYFAMYTAAGPSEVGTSYTKFPFDSGSGKSENSNITASASSDKITVSNLVANVRYMVNLQLSASPKVLSPNIIDVSFKCGSVPDQVQQMDMSGPSGATTKLNYVCAFTLSSGTSVDLQIKAEEAINVTTARFTIYELL